MDLRRYLLLVVPLFCAVAAVAFGPVLFGDATWASLAYQGSVVPAAVAAAREVHAGQWPFWWQGLGLGVPLLEQAAPGALYPAAWLATSARAYDLLLIAHLLYFSLGAALWTRQRGASDAMSALWGAAGLLAVPWLRLGLTGELFAWAQVPWLLLLLGRAIRPNSGHRAAGLAAALLWAAVGLTGSVVFFALFGAAWLVYAMVRWRRHTAWYAGGLALGACLAAPQWLVVGWVAPSSKWLAWALGLWVPAAWLVAGYSAWAHGTLWRWHVARMAVSAEQVGIAMLLAACATLFAAGRGVPTVPRAVLAMQPELWPATLTASDGPRRVLRGQQLFDHKAASELVIARAHHTLQDAFGEAFGAFNVRAGAVHDARLAEAIAHAAASMGQFIDRMGLAYAIIPSSAVVAGGYEALATYDAWSLVATHPARPRAFVTSQVGVLTGAGLWQAIYPTGPAVKPIAFVALDAAVDGTDEVAFAAAAPGDTRVGACVLRQEVATRLVMRCQHDQSGYAVLLDAWGAGWRATVNGVARRIALADGVVRAVPVAAGASQVVWQYEPRRWRAAAALWWLGVAAWMLALGYAVIGWRRERRPNEHRG